MIEDFVYERCNVMDVFGVDGSNESAMQLAVNFSYNFIAFELEFAHFCAVWPNGVLDSFPSPSQNTFEAADTICACSISRSKNFSSRGNSCMPLCSKWKAL